MSIYEFGYYDHVEYGDKSLIGEKVKVVKGRKYPIGSEHIIKGFTAWHDQFKHSTEYIITTEGLKINVVNVRLVKARVWNRPIVRYAGYKATECPNCKGHDLKWQYNYYNPTSDYYVDRYECSTCGLDLESW